MSIVMDERLDRTQVHRHHRPHHHHKKPTKLRSTTSGPVKIDDEQDREDLLQTVEQLTRACDSYRNELQKQEDKNAKELLKLNHENETLQLEMCRLQEKMDFWKSKCQRQEHENVVIARNKMLNRENHTLKQDIEVYKTVIQRLNKEMSFYQDKLRTKFQSSPNKIPVYSTSDSVHSNMEEGSQSSQASNLNSDLQEPQKTLLPLLGAYDEVISEKNEMIKEHEFALEKFKAKCQEIVRENEELHKIVGETKHKGTVSTKDWNVIEENAKLVLEENDLLHEKVEILERKATLVTNTYNEKVDKLKRKLATLEDEKSRLNSSAMEMDKQCSLLSDQITKMSAVIQQRIPVEEHERSVRECKELFEELKRKYSAERAGLLNKVEDSESEKQRLIAEVSDLTADNEKLQAKAESLEASLAESFGTVMKLNTEKTESGNARKEAENTINEMMRLTESMVTEKQSLEVAFHEQRQAMAQIMLVRSQEVQLLHEWQEKIRKMQHDYEEKLEKLQHRITELESLLETVGDRHSADMSQLKDLVHEKNSHIEKLRTEKRQLMDDLETVWKASTKDQKSKSSLSPGRPNIPRSSSNQ